MTSLPHRGVVRVNKARQTLSLNQSFWAMTSRFSAPHLTHFQCCVKSSPASNCCCQNCPCTSALIPHWLPVCAQVQHKLLVYTSKAPTVPPPPSTPTPLLDCDHQSSTPTTLNPQSATTPPFFPQCPQLPPRMPMGNALHTFSMEPSASSPSPPEMSTNTSFAPILPNLLFLFFFCCCPILGPFLPANAFFKIIQMLLLVHLLISQNRSDNISNPTPIFHG